MAKSYNTIVKEMAQGPSKALFIEMEGYCRRNLLDLIETFLETDDIPAKTTKLWLKDEPFMDWVANRMIDINGAKTGRAWFYKDQPRDELVEQSKEVVRHKFLSCRDNSSANAGYIDYIIKDHENKIVEPLIIGEDRFRDIARTLAPIIEKDGHQISTNEAKIIWDYATVHGEALVVKPKLCAQPEHGGWCLHRISVQPDPSKPMPETERFLARINDPEAFAAWCYGVASDRYVGRQVLWVKGEGSDGKSTFFKSFASIFGITAGSIDWTTLKSNPAFAGSLFVNKRFVYVPDNNNPELLNTGLFKSLSDPGSDPVTINHKYGKMYSTELEAHTAVLSNFEPNIRNQTHSLSRTLFLTVAPRDLSVPADKSITDRFIAELPAFLAYGEDCYNRLCTNNTEIKANDSVVAAVQKQMDATSEQWGVILGEHFTIEAEAEIDNAVVYKRLTEECRLNNHQVGEFRAWLKTEHGVEWLQVSNGAGSRPRRYIGMRLKTNSEKQASAGNSKLIGRIS